jgi:PmbA protein
MENNVPLSFWGARKFRYYLGIEDASQIYNFEAEGGSRDESEIRSGKFLEIVEFSDFSVDAISGDIAGEIRLGYYHDNGKVTPVAGGSISGCMLDFTKEMYMSKERRQFDNCLIPALTRLENVSVTGIE